ncbi:MAG: STAS domain-containing protein [Actinomycetota bacterium]
MSSGRAFGLHGRMTTIVMLRGPIARGDIPALCARVHGLLRRGGSGPVIFDISELEEPDAATIDALARLQLTALRLGRRIRLRNACGEVQDLLALVGLVDLLPVIRRSGVETAGQPEQREQVRGVEEETDPCDPIT